MKIAALLMFIPDVHALTLEVAQGLVLTSSFYWDLDDRTRAFSDRLAKRAPGVRAAMGQAGAYAAALHFLKVAADMGAAQAKQDGAATVARMKAMPTDDDAFGKGTIPRRRIASESGLFVRGQDAGREQGTVGLLQETGNDAGRGCVPPARQRRLSAGQNLRRKHVMGLSRRTLLAATAAGTLPAIRRARAEGAKIKIGVLNDQSGTYRDDTGMTGIICCKLAVEEFAGAHGLDVEVIAADHRNKPDVGASIARQWLDQDGVDMIIDVPNSGVALAVQSVVKEKNKVYINSTAGTVRLTGDQCSPNMLHWTFDTYMLARSTGGALVQQGGDTWYFLTADYAFGQQLQKDTSALVQKAGGKVLGASPYPFPDTTDFSSMLVQAQATGAKVLGLANAGLDTANCVKQAHEFGLMPQMKIAALLMFITDVHAVGLEVAQGPGADRELLLGSERQDARLGQARGRAQPEQLAEHEPRRQLRRHAALPQDRRRHGCRGGEEGWRRDGEPDEGDAVRRSLFRHRQDPRGRPRAGPGAPVRGEEAVREQGRVGFVQAAHHNAGRRGVPAAGGRPLRFRQEHDCSRSVRVC